MFYFEDKTMVSKRLADKDSILVCLRQTAHEKT